MNVNELQALAVLALRRMILLAVSAVVALLSLTPLEASELIVATGPMVMLSILVFWTQARAEDVSLFSAFLCGLMFDAVGGGPLGLWALSFVVGTAVARRRTDRVHVTSRFVSLVTYVVAGGLGGLTAWVTASVYFRSLADPAALVAATVISIGVFLLMISLFGSLLLMPTRYMDRISR